ncbi:tyrosine-type recombinase/integrase [Mesorhizobium sp. CAU 1741]|uniref:tyrosine-type recombinase/integrase n=1 Tax=Mesorhizobium sp. CAU 1741 TaxID=3140366 RepID=UPI00325BA034
MSDEAIDVTTKVEPSVECASEDRNFRRWWSQAGKIITYQNPVTNQIFDDISVGWWYVNGVRSGVRRGTFLARSAANDRQYLEPHRGKWRVTVSVPIGLREKLGTRLKHPLGTDSLAMANAMKWPIVHEFKAQIAQAAGSGTDLRAVAEEFRRQRKTAKSDAEADEVETGISITIDALLGREVGTEVDPYSGEETPIYSLDKLKQVETFKRVLDGNATPLDEPHKLYMCQLTVKPRTKSDDRRAIALLQRWCGEREVPPYLQSFPTRKSAVAFVDDLQRLEPTLSPVTLNKYVNRLSRYWQWLEKREEVPSDIWKGLALPVPVQSHDEKERPFTEEEMKKLLRGNATPAMHDLMRIAALTGCRLDPIVCLRVQDCANGTFLFKPQKKEKAARLCPIHSDLMEIVERRTSNKNPEDPIFPEWPGLKSGAIRERSTKTSNAFTAYRRKVGVADERDGRRRSLVNFHSFRRWFVTEAERADQPEHLIAAVVGHKRDGMTLGLYSAGPKLEQARRVVEAVKLPL